MSFPEKIRINGRWYSGNNYRQFAAALDEPWRTAIVYFLDDWYNAETYIEVQTSGSTGEPKTIRLSKEHMLNSAAMTCQFFGLNAGSKALLCLPADYIAGKMMIVRAFVSSMDLIAVQPVASPFQHLKEPIDFVAVTPYQFVNSYQSIQETPIKKMIIGGSQVSLRLQKMMEELETEIYETYGMTETCSHIALRKLNGENASEYFETLPGVKIALDNRNCLTIKAPSLSHSELITNDVVEMKDATHFKWLGRFDNVINSGGIKIFPEQIEKKLEPYIDRRFFIGAAPNEVFGQKVILVIEGENYEPAQMEKLLNQTKALNKYEKPKDIIFIKEFDISTSGKILKNKIITNILR